MRERLIAAQDGPRCESVGSCGGSPSLAADSTQGFGAQEALGAARRYDGMDTLLCVLFYISPLFKVRDQDNGVFLVARR